jgi:uncharacterized protein YbcV (DUF1398 family)
MRIPVYNLLKNRLFNGGSIRIRNMATARELESLLEKAEQEKWPFPKKLEALGKEGVKSYTVQVGTYHVIYTGERFGEWIQPVPKTFKPLTISERFDTSGILVALDRRGPQQKTTYLEFLSEIAANGVAYYEVDLGNRTVTYFNRGGTLHYLQQIPLWKDVPRT